MFALRSTPGDVAGFYKNDSTIGLAIFELLMDIFRHMPMKLEIHVGVAMQLYDV